MTADPGLDIPQRDLTEFPPTDFDQGEDLFRAVSVGNGPWWFGSAGDQRFDLGMPEGTCYTAQNLETAIREKARRPLLSHRVVDPAFIDEMEVCELQLQSSGRYAETDAGRAPEFGVNREINTCTDYSLTCQWAQAFRSHNFDGIHYGSRFTTGPANCVAIFNEHGERSVWPVERRLSGSLAMEAAGMAHLIADRPKHRHAVILDPPDGVR